jgi:hypothetical protein
LVSENRKITMNRRLITVSILVVALLAIFALSEPIHPVGAQAIDTPTPTPTPTETPVATDTPVPTDTPVATDTPVPTDTPVATDTPTPTDTLTETSTPSETPTAIPTLTETPSATPTTPPSDPLFEPHLSFALNQLAQSYGLGGTAAAGKFAQSQDVTLQKGGANVQVTAILASGKTIKNARNIVASLSGIVEIYSGNLVQISIPISNLRALAASTVFSGVRVPARPEFDAGAGQFYSQGVTNSGANTWQDNGITGAGIRVAILDGGFSGYAAAQTTGDLPPSSRLHLKSFRADGNISTTSNHGNQVAQIVYDMAPGAEMWLVNFGTDVEFAAAVDYLISQNVQIINGSFSWEITMMPTAPAFWKIRSPGPMLTVSCTSRRQATAPPMVTNRKHLVRLRHQSRRLTLSILLSSTTGQWLAARSIGLMVLSAL